MSYKTDFTKIDTSKYYFDKKAADSAVRYIEQHCYHVKGSLAGHHFILEGWQKDEIIRPLFGWKHIEPTIVTDPNGKEVARINKRKYRKAYIEIPKKNGKSTLLSAIAQIFLDIDPEQGSEIVGVAWGRKQASIIFDMVEKSVRKSPRLADKIDYYMSTKVLLSKDREKRYSVWSKEAGTEDGQFPQLVLIDELHEHKNGDVVSVAEKSMMGRINPLSLTITTAGDSLTSIGYERSQYCKKVAKGIIKDESQLVCIYCAEPDADIYDVNEWYSANPQLGKSVSIEDFREEVKQAKVSGAAENAFRRYFLNIWTNAKDVWLSDEVWMGACWPYKLEDLEGRSCFGGMDLSSTSDITAFTLIFPIDGKFISLNWFWLPEDKGKNSADGTREYSTWIKQGNIIETPGNVVDYDYIRGQINELSEKYRIEKIAYDPYNSTQLAIQLTDDGYHLEPFRQGYVSMNAPTKELERLILAKNFNHLGNPVLRWMASNAIILTDSTGNIKIDRDKKREKVDGIITNVMALAMCIGGEVGQSSIDRGELYII